MGSVRPSGGAFSEPRRISPPRGTEEEGESGNEKEEREIAESAMSAGGAQPAVDGAGNTTVAFTYFDGSARVIQTAARPAGGEWSPPETVSEVSEPGEGASSPDLGIDGAGNAIVSWAQREGTGEGTPRIVQVGVKPPGGSFSVLPDVSPPGQVAQRPVLGVSPTGGATVVWRITGATETTLMSSTRPPGGEFSAPANLSSGADSPLFHEIAVGEGGSAIVVWSGDEGGGEVVRAAVRAAGAGSFGGPVAISQVSGDLLHPKPSMDAAGDATVVWVRDDGSTTSVIAMAGYDADPPQLSGISIPPAGRVAEPLTFAAIGSDVWLAGAPTFDFGDGFQAAGAAVSHAYAAPGLYTVTVSAGDAVGKTATSTGTVLVKARNSFKIVKLRRNRRKGTATLVIARAGTGLGRARRQGRREGRRPEGARRERETARQGRGQAPQAPEEVGQGQARASDRLPAGRRRSARQASPHHPPQAAAARAQVQAARPPGQAPLTPGHLTRLRRRVSERASIRL